ncbi:hypothetical protein [Streptomyces sp. 2R]|uniref:hypothetical protein n=1 Tax=Streptomyces sp. 2R TaxID=1883452 RepID=UPI0011814D26|nr:hypothetical protein [Streptomyces sp. 2R]
MDTAITTRRMILGPLPALLAAVLLTGCVTVPAGPPAPRPNQAATTPPPAPAPDVQPAGGSDALVRIEIDHPERARSRPSSRPPAAVPQRRRAAPPAPRPGPPRLQPQQPRPAPARRPAVQPRTPNPVPQMRALCRNAGGVVSGAVSQLCRQTYGR